MPKIGKYTPYADRLCDRCGSKRKVSRTWTEKIENDHGGMILYNTQIICTNKECQDAFEKKEKKEQEKRDLRKTVKSKHSSIKISTMKAT